MNDIEKKLSRIDLNLLVSLSVLMKTRNVSRAADELYLSQSAMSRTLQRLRDTFDDPLFNRTSKGIVPTARAEEISLFIPAILSSIETLIEKNNFDPLTSKKSFSVSIPPLIGQLLTPKLVLQMAQQAPNVILNELPAKLSPQAALTSGQLDFSIHITPIEDDNFSSEKLTSIKPIIYGRNKHPLSQQDDVKLPACLDYNFAELIINEDLDAKIEHPISNLLFSQFNQRNIAFKSFQLANIQAIVQQTDLLMLGTDLFQQINHNNDLVPVYQFDIAKSKQISLYLIHHKRVDNSDAHHWFKQLIMSLFTAA